MATIGTVVTIGSMATIGNMATLGIVTAPRAGLYSFSFTAGSRASAGDHMYSQLQLMRNGEVYVLLRIGHRLCGDAEGRNAFSGYMVHAIES
ncbi:unnamed protein product [Lota lota]